jgi:Flp pilus assembly protein TadG
MNSQLRSKGNRKTRRDFGGGQSAVELAFVVPVLVVLLVVAGDFGRLFFANIGVKNAARAGAQYGSQSVITAADANGMNAAAKQDYSTVTATASQCTCGTSSSVPKCQSSYCTNDPQGNYVTVNAQTTFKTILTYPGIPSSITLKGTAVMQVQQQ